MRIEEGELNTTWAFSALADEEKETEIISVL
jgi:hypothetical protein